MKVVAKVTKRQTGMASKYYMVWAFPGAVAPLPAHPKGMAVPLNEGPAGVIV